jgi:hypothetical protein
MIRSDTMKIATMPRAASSNPFEHRQADLAQKRQGKLGLQIVRLPGGHLTTHEQPEALAASIAKFERNLSI